MHAQTAWHTWPSTNLLLVPDARISSMCRRGTVRVMVSELNVDRKHYVTSFEGFQPFEDGATDEQGTF